MKECKKCGQIKALDEFHKHKSMGDGRLSTCKVCYNEKSRQREEAKRRRMGVKKKEIKPKPESKPVIIPPNIEALNDLIFFHVQD